MKYPKTRLVTHLGQNVFGRLYSSESVCVHRNMDMAVVSRVRSSVLKFFSPEKMEPGLSGVLQVAAGVMGRRWLGFW